MAAILSKRIWVNNYQFNKSTLMVKVRVGKMRVTLILNVIWYSYDNSIKNQYNRTQNPYRGNAFVHHTCPIYGWFSINKSKPRQNGRHFPDDIFKWIFLNENVWISIKKSLKFVPRGPIGNIPALVQIMAWRRPGDKPLSEPMTVNLITHICVTRPQWVGANKGLIRCIQIMHTEKNREHLTFAWHATVIFLCEATMYTNCIIYDVAVFIVCYSIFTGFIFLLKLVRHLLRFCDILRDLVGNFE